MKKLFLSVLSYLLCVTMTFAQEDSIKNKANSFFRNVLAKKTNFYMPIKTVFIDSIKLKDLVDMDTSILNKISTYSKILDFKKLLTITNNYTYKIQKRINKNLVDKKVLYFYDTLNPDYNKINLLDSSLKYNKEIIEDENYTFKIYHCFTYKNRDNINIVDTATIFYTPKPIRIVSGSFTYKKGFNFLGTFKFNRDILKEEREIALEELQKNKK